VCHDVAALRCAEVSTAVWLWVQTPGYVGMSAAVSATQSSGDATWEV
jgi:hypothetical protein